LKTLILAAGKGTRLHPITKYIPKPMLPLHGKPLMEWVILSLIAFGIRDFVVAVSYLAEQIENYFGLGDKWHININYSRGPEPAGKAGEIWRARKLLNTEEEPFLVVPGDTICHLNYRDLLDFHQNHGGPVTVALSTRYRLEVGTAKIDEQNLIKEFHEKPNLDQPVSSGAYVLDNNIFPYIEKFDPDKREVDLPGDIFPYLLQQGTPIYGYIDDYHWWDVGRVSDYESLIKLPSNEVAKVLPWRFSK